MVYDNIFRGSRLFWYAGLGLILLAIIVFPLKLKYLVGDPNYPLWSEWEDFSVGMLFAPIIGSWGLASMVIGIAESTLSKKRTLLVIMPILGILNAWVACIVWMGIPFSFTIALWWVIFVLSFVPWVIAGVVGILGIIKKETVVKALANPRRRIITLSVLFLVPGLFAVSFLILWTLYA